MNIFYTDHNPCVAAQSLPDKHIVKMPVEAVQMLVSACRRYGYQPGVITKAGELHKGGYHNHPCTVWAGDTIANFRWTLVWGIALCAEYQARYGKTHFAQGQLFKLTEAVGHLKLMAQLTEGELTTPALAMPDECKTSDPVESYRNCIRAKVASKPDSFVWRKGTPQPAWL